MIAQFASLALLSLALVQEPAADLAGRLQSTARAAVAESGLPGVSVRIATRDGVLLSRGLGYLDEERKRIESPLALRDGEALVEPLIVTGLLAQVDAGKLALEAPLTDFFPKLSLGGQRVLVIHLVEQASGIPDCSDWLAVREEPATAADVLAWLEQRTLDADPGTCTAYSASNVVLAGLLLERVTGHPLREYLGEHVIEPLGLEETRFEERVEPREASATLRAQVETPRELLGLPPLATQLVDLERFVRGLGAGKLVAAVSLRELRVGALSLPRHGSRCAGFARSTVARNEALTFGSNGARGSLHVAWYPDLELSITLATSADTEDLPVLERRLTRAILDLPEPGIVDLPVTRDQREVYLGGYYIGCTRVTIEERGDTLEYLTPYGDRHRLRYQGHDRFVSAEDPEVSFDFSVEHGRAVAFVLTQRGMQTTARRLE
ncbi:MAG: serine hydrolase domain-containing protein [Planctomycetota bacterium]